MKYFYASVSRILTMPLDICQKSRGVIALTIRWPELNGTLVIDRLDLPAR